MAELLACKGCAAPIPTPMPYEAELLVCRRCLGIGEIVKAVPETDAPTATRDLKRTEPTRGPDGAWYEQFVPAGKRYYVKRREVSELSYRAAITHL